MEYYSIGKFARLIGTTEQTLRNWDKKGTLKPHHITESGYRYYSQQQLNRLLGIKNHKDKTKIVIGYCRVSNNRKKDDLHKQIENVKTYMYAKGYQFEIISDIGSGTNYKNKGLNELIKRVINLEVEKIVVLYKDRLVSYGFELIENICNKYSTDIEIIDSTKKTEEHEVVEDLVQIMNTFSSMLEDKYSNKIKKIIKELTENDNIEEG